MRGAEGEGAGVITPGFCFLFSSLILYVLFFFRCSCNPVPVGTNFTSLYSLIYLDYVGGIH